jgi:hypothetical protein
MATAYAATECPVSREAFMASGEITLDVGGVTFTASPKAFSTGSFGYNLNGKLTLEIGGQLVRFQLSGNLVAIGSKGK